MANYYVSSVAYAAIQTWTTLHTALGTGGTISLNTFVIQTSPTTGNERVFKCTTSGTIGSAEPTWSLTFGATTSEAGHGGTAVWTCRGGQEADQSAGNWTAPLARLSQLPGGTNAQTSHPILTKDTVFVSSDHAETQAASITYLNSNSAQQLRFLSVSRVGASLPPTSADLTRGGSVTCSGNQTTTLIDYDNYWWGIDFFSGSTSGGAVIVRGQGGQISCWENCSFQATGAGASQIIIGASSNSVTSTVMFDNTYVKFSNAGQTIAFTSNSFEWRNTDGLSGRNVAVQGTVPTNLFAGVNIGNNPPGKIFMHGLDLSNVTTNIFSTGSAANSDTYMRDCKLANGVTVGGSAHTGWNSYSLGIPQLLVDNCDDATNGRSYRMYRGTYSGAVQTNSVIARTGGNTDGTTLFSWEMLLTGVQPSTFGNAMRFPEIQQRLNTTGVSKTLTVYGTSSFSAIPTNANLWLDVDYLGNSTSPMATLVSSRATDILASGSNLSADTSLWNANVPARQNSHAYNTGDLIVPTGNTTRAFVCTAAGTSAGSEPGAYASAVDGGNVTDGGATFMAMWRWKLSVTFTPQMIGTVKCSIKTILYAGSSGVSNFLFVDPTFVLS